MNKVMPRNNKMVTNTQISIIHCICALSIELAFFLMTARNHRVLGATKERAFLSHQSLEYCQMLNLDSKVTSIGQYSSECEVRIGSGILTYNFKMSSLELFTYSVYKLYQ